MDDISLRLLQIGAEVRVPSLLPLSKFPPWNSRRSRDLERYLELSSEVGAQKVCFRMVGARSRLVGDRALIGFARFLVEARRRGDEVGDIDRLPGYLACLWVVDLAVKLNSWVPEAVENTWSARFNDLAIAVAHPTAEWIIWYIIVTPSSVMK
jgi:hypothetical protein